MPKDTKTLGYIKAPACESRGFVIYKKRVHHFDTPSLLSDVSRETIGLPIGYRKFFTFLIYLSADKSTLFPTKRKHPINVRSHQLQNYQFHRFNILWFIARNINISPQMFLNNSEDFVYLQVN